jgi:chemotaxis protein methyltransferase CheR
MAELGIYRSEMLTPVAADLRSRYLMRSRDRASDLYRIVPELRARVRFARLNLMEMTYPIDRDMDVVFCRNILIYFESATQRAVLRRLYDHLRPGGYLILGHSESLCSVSLPLRPLGTNVFRKD